MQRKARIGGARAVAAALAAMGGLAASPARATDADGQVWLTLNALTQWDKIGLQLDLQSRLTDNFRHPNQENARLTITYPLNRAVSLGGGYYIGYSELPDVSDLVEHRPFEQVSVAVGGLPKGVSLVSRTRLEQRVRREATGTGLRAFEQVKAQFPLVGRLGGIALIEAAWNFNTTPWGQRTGFGTARAAVQLNVPVNASVSVQPGYSGQYVKRWHNEGRFYHAFLLNLVVKA